MATLNIREQKEYGLTQLFFFFWLRNKVLQNLVVHNSFIIYSNYLH